MFENFGPMRGRDPFAQKDHGSVREEGNVASHRHDLSLSSSRQGREQRHGSKLLEVDVHQLPVTPTSLSHTESFTLRNSQPINGAPRAKASKVKHVQRAIKRRIALMAFNGQVESSTHPFEPVPFEPGREQPALELLPQHWPQIQLFSGSGSSF